MLRSIIGSWVTAWREQYSRRGWVPEQLERVGAARRCRRRAPRRRPRRAQRLVGGGEERVERDVLHEHGTVVARDAGEVEVVVREVDGEREHAQAVVVGRPLAGRKLLRVVAHASGGAARGGACSATRIHHGMRIAASAVIHGGVESSPHSHGWMSVTSGEPSSRRSRNSQRWYSSTFGASSATNRVRSSRAGARRRRARPRSQRGVAA